MDSTSVSSTVDATEDNDAVKKRKSLDSGLVRGVLWTGGVKWFIQLVSWPATILTAQLLSPQDYGYLALVSVITRFVLMLTEAGLSAAIVNGVKLDATQIKQLNTVSSLAGVLGFLAVALVSWPASLIYRDQGLQPVLLVLGASLILEGIAVVPAATLRRNLDFKRLSLAEGARHLTDLSLTLILAATGAKYWSLVIGCIAGVAVWTFFVRRFSPVEFAKPQLARLREVLEFSKHILSRNISGFAAYSSDAALGGLSMSKAALGHYSFGSTLAYAPADKVTQLILRVVPAVLGNVRDSRSELARYFLSITSVITLISFPMFVGIAFVAPDLVPVLLGPQWLGIIPVVIPFCVYGMISELVCVVPHLLQSVGETRVLARNGVYALLVMPLAFFALSSRFGAPGLAGAWAVGAAILNVYPLLVACRSVNVSVTQFARGVRTPIIGSSVMLGVLYVIRLNGLMASWPIKGRLAMTVLTGAAIYALTIMALDMRKLRGLADLMMAMRRGRASGLAVPSAL